MKFENDIFQTQYQKLKRLNFFRYSLIGFGGILLAFLCIMTFWGIILNTFIPSVLIFIPLFLVVVTVLIYFLVGNKIHAMYKYFFVSYETASIPDKAKILALFSLL